MKSHIFVHNIGGQAGSTSIINTLGVLPAISSIDVNVDAGKISFDCYDKHCGLHAISTLKKAGNPIAGKGLTINGSSSGKPVDIKIN